MATTTPKSCHCCSTSTEQKWKTLSDKGEAMFLSRGDAAKLSRCGFVFKMFLEIQDPISVLFFYFHIWFYSCGNEMAGDIIE